MLKPLIFLVVTLNLVAPAFSQDPVVSDGDKYKTIMENDKVRVLEYKDKPGDKTSRHHHPDFVLYALDSFKRKLIFGNGKQVEREFKKGDVIWMDEQFHTGENIGTTETHVIIVEMKAKTQTNPDSLSIPKLEKKWNAKKGKDSGK